MSKKNRILNTASVWKTVVFFIIGFLLIITTGFGFNVIFDNNQVVKNIPVSVNSKTIYTLILIVVTIIGFTTSIQLLSASGKLKKSIGIIQENKTSIDFENLPKKVWIIWNKYKVTRIDPEKVKTEYKEFEYKTRVNADLYFNSEEIGGLSLSLFKLIPGTFVGLGILGTFIGFAASLKNGINIQNPEEIETLVNGLKVAFNTSIFGLISSIVFNFLIGYPILHSLSNQCRHLSDVLDARFYISDEECMRTLGSIVFETRETITTSTSNMADKVAEAILEGRKEFTESLTNVTDTLRKVSDELGKTPDRIKVMNEELKESIQTSKDNNQAMLDSSISSIETNIKNLYEGFAERFDESSKTVAESVESMKNLPEQITGMLNDSTEQLSTDLKSVMDKTADRIDTLLNNTESSMKETFNDCADKFTSAQIELIESVKNDLSVLSNNMKEDIKEISKNTKEEISSLSESMKNDFSDCIESSKSGVDSLVEDTKTQLTDCYEGFATSVANSVEKIDEINTGLKQMEEQYASMEVSMKNISESIQAAEKDLSESVSSVFEKAPAEMEKLVNNLKNSSEQITKVSELLYALKSSMEGLPGEIDKNLQEMAKTVKLLHNDYYTTLEGIKELRAQVNKKSDDNEDRLDKYRNIVNEITESDKKRRADVINLGKQLNANFDDLFKRIEKLVNKQRSEAGAK